MSNEDKICQAYIEELQYFEKFRLTHSTLYHDTPLEIEDPSEEYQRSTSLADKARKAAVAESRNAQISITSWRLKQIVGKMVIN